MKRFLLIAIALIGSLLLQAQFLAEKSISSKEGNVEDQLMQIEVYDVQTRMSVEADVFVKGLNARKTVVLEDIMDTTLAVKNYRIYTVSCIKEGYMYYAHKFWPDEKKMHVEPVQLRPLSVGLKTNIEDITFLGDETEIYYKSAPALDEILQFLNTNSAIKICIIGHVNGPDNEKGASFYRKASEKRANSVRDYLISHGIDAERLTIRGAGNSEMIYTDPQTDWQTDANRRVEIEIISL